MFEKEKVGTIDILRLLYRRRSIIIAAFCLSLIASVTITAFISPRYYSYATIFPPNTNKSDDILHNPQFGYDVHADRLIQLLNSEVLRDSLVRMYDLVNYYELDTQELDWKHVLSSNYAEDVQFDRTKYMSVVIRVTTKDPYLSAKMANSAIDIVNGLQEQIFEENRKSALEAAEAAYFDKVKLVNTYVDSIYGLRADNTDKSAALLHQRIKDKQANIDKLYQELASLRNDYNFNDLSTQIEQIELQLAANEASIISENGKLNVLKASYAADDSIIVNMNARLEGYKKSKEHAEAEMKKLGPVQKQYQLLNHRLNAELAQLKDLQLDYENMLNAFEPSVTSIRLDRLINQYTFEQARLNELKTAWEKAVEDYEAPFPTVYVIDRAQPSLRKISPSYTLNTILGVTGTMLFTILFLVFRERYRWVWKAITEEA